jgi:serine O-acetyltransferase
VDFLKISYVLNTISEDFKVKYKDSFNFFTALKYYFFDLSFRVVVLYRLQYYFGKKNKLLKILSLCIKNNSIKKYGFEVGITTKIGGGFLVHHINGVVLGEGVKIGNNFNLFQQVTIGQKNNEYPILGDRVTVYPGSILIGKIEIGDDVLIGANSVVLKNVPMGEKVAGIPANSISVKREGM